MLLPLPLAGAAEGRRGVKLLLLEVWAWLLLGRACVPFLVTGLEELWSMPGVLRIEGLSSLGLNCCCPCGTDS
jgi:hypothetical protein